MRQLLQLLTLAGILLGGLYQHTQAQNNPAVLYGSHFHQQAARLNPSKLGDSYNDLDITGLPLPLPTFNLYSWGGNNRLNAKDFQKYFISGGNTVDNAIIEEFVGRFGNKNIVGVGAQLQLFGVAFKINKKTRVMDMNNPDLADIPVIKRDEIVTISLGWNERMAASVRLSPEMLAFAWKGNGHPDFLDKTIDLGNTKINAYWLREFALGAAMPIYKGLDINVRAGVRLKYLQGMAAMRSRRANATILTQSAENGGTITTNIDYFSNFSSPVPVDEKGEFEDIPTKKFLGSDDFPKLPAQGSGFGVDLGVTVTLQDRFVGTFSLVDVGGVRFKRRISNFKLNNQITFNGIEVPADPSTGLLGGADGILDSLINNFELERTFDKFSIPLPTRMMFQAEYKVPRIDKKGRKYNKHHFFLTYIQGFGEYGISTARPSFTAAYSHNLGQQVSVGLSAASGGYSGFGIGSFMSFKLGYYRLGFGTNNITALLLRSGGKGADISFNISTAFR
ncbi:DUF5723 family protein [uncultured Microscilla sp.]|uniref:DUF5723 family protein n=1 Tax=uncultured Microscilla sp. TaxID=432653 RepID=UPI00262D1DC1|nr:DUF5723 family protein [uncultured Microscilla sp.]